MKLSDILPQLRAKFPAEVHKERELPGTSKTWWYVPWQAIRDRLDEICPDDWSVSYSPATYLGEYCNITCRLTICGLTREGVGSVPVTLLSSRGKDMARGNPTERAVAESFKTAAEQFGIAAYLDEQTDEKTRLSFIKFMQRSGNGKPLAEYYNQQRTANGESPKPKPSNLPAKPFGQPQPSPLITDEQRKRFWTTAKNTGYTEDGIRALIAASNFSSTKEITLNAYQVLCEKAADPDLRDIYNEQSTKTQRAS
jgi:hypothetical protein